MTTTTIANAPSTSVFSQPNFSSSSSSKQQRNGETKRREEKIPFLFLTTCLSANGIFIDRKRPLIILPPLARTLAQHSYSKTIHHWHTTHRMCWYCCCCCRSARRRRRRRHRRGHGRRRRQLCTTQCVAYQIKAQTRILFEYHS